MLKSLRSRTKSISPSPFTSPAATCQIAVSQLRRDVALLEGAQPFVSEDQQFPVPVDERDIGHPIAIDVGVW